MGLVNGREVPIIAGGKIDGRVGSASFARRDGGRRSRTGRRRGAHDDGGRPCQTKSLARVLRRLHGKPAGDPARPCRQLARGSRFLTYLTSTFLGNKNFSVNAAVAGTGRWISATTGWPSSARSDYPNEKWNIRLWFRRAGRDFDPSLGFVPRRGDAARESRHLEPDALRPQPIQEMSMGIDPIVTLESPRHVGDLRERHHRRQLALPQRRSRPGHDHPVRRSARAALPGVAERRHRAGGVPHGYGVWRLHDRAEAAAVCVADPDLGTLLRRECQEWNTSLVWNPTPLYTLEFTGERHAGALPGGAFTQHVIGTRLRINVSSDLTAGPPTAPTASWTCTATSRSASSRSASTPTPAPPTERHARQISSLTRGHGGCSPPGPGTDRGTGRPRHRGA